MDVEVYQNNLLPNPHHFSARTILPFGTVGKQINVQAHIVLLKLEYASSLLLTYPLSYMNFEQTWVCDVCCL
jgi:hypothetical protein